MCVTSDLHIVTQNLRPLYHLLSYRSAPMDKQRFLFALCSLHVVQVAGHAFCAGCNLSQGWQRPTSLAQRCDTRCERVVIATMQVPAVKDVYKHDIKGYAVAEETSWALLTGTKL